MVDLGLLPTAHTAQYSSTNSDGKPFAVYPLVSLTSPVTQQLRADLTSDPNTNDFLSLQSSTAYVGKPLSEILTHRLSPSTAQNFDPTLFITVHITDFAAQGVYLVDLNVDLAGQVAKLRAPTSEALLYAISLQVGNTDWEGLDCFDPPPSSSNPSPPGPPPPSSKPTRPILAAYSIHDTANMTTLHPLLDPLRPSKSDPSAWRAVSIGSYSSFDPSSPQPLDQVTYWHPWQCLRDEDMDRHWVVVLDNDQPKTKGVLVVRMEWDETLLRVEDTCGLLGCVDSGTAGSVGVQRVDVGEALAFIDAEREREARA